MEYTQLTRFISLSIGALVVLIAVSSFALSYVNLRQVAISAGIPESLAFLWPILLDAFLVVGSLVILRSNLEQSPVWPGWMVLITFTGVSTVFNIIESKGGIAMAAHAVPPVALCISLELLMRTINPCSDSAQGISESAQTISDLAQVISGPEQSCSDDATDLSTLSNDTILAHIRANPDDSDDDIAKKFGISRSTVWRKRKVLLSMSWEEKH
jgi:hypothetical protein